MVVQIFPFCFFIFQVWLFWRIKAYLLDRFTWEPSTTAPGRLLWSKPHIKETFLHLPGTTQLGPRSGSRWSQRGPQCQEHWGSTSLLSLHLTCHWKAQKYFKTILKQPGFLLWLHQRSRIFLEASFCRLYRIMGKDGSKPWVGPLTNT